MLVVLLLLALIDFIQFVCASMCRLVGVRTVLMELLSSDGQCVLSQLTMHSDIHLGAINRRAPQIICVWWHVELLTRARAFNSSDHREDVGLCDHA